MKCLPTLSPGVPTYCTESSGNSIIDVKMILGSRTKGLVTIDRTSTPSLRKIGTLKGHCQNKKKGLRRYSRGSFFTSNSLKSLYKSFLEFSELGVCYEISV